MKQVQQIPGRQHTPCYKLYASRMGYLGIMAVVLIILFFAFISNTIVAVSPSKIVLKKDTIQRWCVYKYRGFRGGSGDTLTHNEIILIEGNHFKFFTGSKCEYDDTLRAANKKEDVNCQYLKHTHPARLYFNKIDNILVFNLTDINGDGACYTFKRCK